MKLILIVFFSFTSFFTFAQSDTITPSFIDTTPAKLSIDKSDSTTSMFGNIHSDYTFFGYSKPDTNSTKLIIFSVFTNQVKDNPHKCKYGAHYGDNSLGDKSIKFSGYNDEFGKFQLIKNNIVIDQLFFKKDYFKFDE
jgi:hypothetical protein